MVDIMEVLNNMSITTAVIIGISAGALLFGFEYGINRLVMKYFPEDKPESLPPPLPRSVLIELCSV